MKKWWILLLCLSVVLLSGCSNGATPDSNIAAHVLEAGNEIIPMEQLTPVANGKAVGYQLEAPEKGEEIAVITMADGQSFKLRFFPDEAPKAVYNFKKHALAGYYNGLSFHRIIQNFMIQGGDPDGSGRGGASVWETYFKDEFATNLLNITGAVSMANRGADTNGSQFFINTPGDSRPNWENYEQAYAVYKTNPERFTAQYGKTINMEKVTQEVKGLYDQQGGNPHLDGAYCTIQEGHTVFAQVFEGMDVVNALSKSPVDSDGYTPVDPVVISKVEILVYE